MMRSLFSGVSGLKNHQTKLDVIGNNVSNVNTIGFKRSNTTFNDVISQTLSGATAANDNTGRGGTNAMQIGLGSNVSSITTIMTSGSPERTDDPNDVMISGDGFFIVSDSTGFYFTRAGAFQVDDVGNLIDSNGLKVCGWNTDASGKIVQGRVSGLNLKEGSKSYLLPEMTTSITFKGNINPDTNPTQESTITFYDSLGNSYRVTATLTFSSENKTWDVEIGSEAQVNDNPDNTVQLNFSQNTLSAPLDFDDDGTLSSQDANNLTITTNVEFANEADNKFGSVFADEITINFSQLTQLNGRVDAQAITDDGMGPGNLKGYSIGSNGVIVGSYTNGLTKNLGQIAIANFPNPAGLEKAGSNLYTATVNSGDFDGIGVDVGVLGSTLIGGAREMSNVDIAYEFTQMIITERGFQANSRIITTSDEMLQELVNLKR